MERAGRSPCAIVVTLACLREAAGEVLQHLAGGLSTIARDPGAREWRVLPGVGDPALGERNLTLPMVVAPAGRPQRLQCVNLAAGVELPAFQQPTIDVGVQRGRLDAECRA